MDDDDDREFPPSLHPWREAATMIVAALVVAALIVYAGRWVWSLL